MGHVFYHPHNDHFLIGGIQTNHPQVWWRFMAARVANIKVFNLLYCYVSDLLESQDIYGILV